MVSKIRPIFLYMTYELHFIPRKTPWKLSPTRKANVRARLKKVDSVIEAVRASGMQCAALVSIFAALFAQSDRHFHRQKHLNCRRSTRCQRRTSTLCSQNGRRGIVRAYIRCRNGRG
jgi:hypothetical protein